MGNGQSSAGIHFCLDLLSNPEQHLKVRRQALERLRRDVSKGKIGTADAAEITYLLMVSADKLKHQHARSRSSKRLEILNQYVSSAYQTY